jgi:hypothetical protein
MTTFWERSRDNKKNVVPQQRRAKEDTNKDAGDTTACTGGRS